MTTYTEAQDDMLAIVLATAARLNLGVEYEAKEGEKPATEVGYVRPTLRHADGRQASLAGLKGMNKYRQLGTLWVGVFTPIGTGLSENYDLCHEFVKAFRKVSTEHCVFFRNHRIREVGASGSFYHINTLIDFEYDDHQ